MIYLASESPRRHDLLKKYQIPFTVIPNRLLIEDLPKVSNNVLPLLRTLAKEKVIASKKGVSGIVLGVDTSVILGEEVLGKPKSLKDAKTTLNRLSGKTHRVISGLCMLDTHSQKCITRTETSWVTFNVLTDETIDWYIKTHKPFDKAGSYGIQDCPEILIASVRGSIENVMGLPIQTLKKVLKKF